MALRFELQVAEGLAVFELAMTALRLNPTVDMKQKSERRSLFEEYESAIFLAFHFLCLSNPLSLYAESLLEIAINGSTHFLIKQVEGGEGKRALDHA